MRKLLVLTAIVCFLIGGLYVIHGQQVVPGATAVQQSQPLYTCNQFQTATGAGNTAVTVTFTPPAGQFVYLCSFYASQTNPSAASGSTAGAGPAPIYTTTNLQNNLVWWGTNAVIAAGAMFLDVDEVFSPWTVKSNVPGTAVTIVTSAGGSTYNVRLNATAFFAP